MAVLGASVPPLFFVRLLSMIFVFQYFNFNINYAYRPSELPPGGAISDTFRTTGLANRKNIVRDGRPVEL